MEAERSLPHFIPFVLVLLGVLDVYATFEHTLGDFIDGLGVLQWELQRLLNLKVAKYEGLLILRQ